jgi:hypothetical protein
MVRRANTIRNMSRLKLLNRNWLALWLQERRRKRLSELPPPGPAVPAAPGNLQGHDEGGVVGLTWDLTGVQFADGISIEARRVQNGAQFSEVGSTGPSETSFDFDAQGFSAWQCRVRAFNSAGYSEYSEWVEVDLV